MWMCKRHGVRAGSLGRCKCVCWNRWVKLPIGEYQGMAQSLRIVQVNRMEQSRQLIFDSNPRLYEHAVVDICDHVSRRSADHFGLTDVIGQLHAFRHLLVRIGDNPVRKREIDCSGVIGLLQRCVDGRRGVCNSHQIFGRCVGHHFFSVVVKLRGRTITWHDYPKLVRFLESDLGLCGKSEGMTMTAWTLIKMQRVEFHCPRRGEPATCSFKNVECLWLERRRGFRCTTCLSRGGLCLLLGCRWFA